MKKQFYRFLLNSSFFNVKNLNIVEPQQLYDVKRGRVELSDDNTDFLKGFFVEIANKFEILADDDSSDEQFYATFNDLCTDNRIHFYKIFSKNDVYNVKKGFALKNIKTIKYQAKIMLEMLDIV